MIEAIGVTASPFLSITISPVAASLHQRGVASAATTFFGVAGLREADGEREHEDEGERGDDALERMELSLHCGEFP